jgi:3-hydroxyacyl-[acyl-carrier-protein] dehydratase
MNSIRAAITAAAAAPAEYPEAGTIERRYCFAPDFPGFAGHFPGYAVLPAVVQLLAAVVLAEELAGGPLRMVAVDGAKFLRQLRPGDEITVRCREKRRDAAVVYEGSLSVPAGLAASFLLTLAAAEEGC